MRSKSFRASGVALAIVAAIAAGATGIAFASRGEHENGEGSVRVLDAKISLAQAVAAAEQHTGGRAIKIEMERGRDGYVYEVKTAFQGKLTTVFVSPADGKVVRVDERGMIEKVLDREDRNEIASIVAAPTTLGAAIATAEQQAGGKAVEAAVEHENGTFGFEIEVAKDGDVKRVFIDAASGQVVKMAAAEDHEDHEE